MRTVLACGIAALAMTIAMAAGGCGKKAQQPKTADSNDFRLAKTPREAGANFIRALQTGDKALFFVTINSTAYNQDMFDAGFDLTAAMSSFAKDFGAAYKRTLPENLSAQPAPTVAEYEEKATVKEENDKAMIALPGGKRVLKAVRLGAVWKINPEFAEGERSDEFLQQARQTTKAINDLRAKIGKPGASADQIQQEYAKIVSAEAATAPTATAPASRPS